MSLLPLQALSDKLLAAGCNPRLIAIETTTTDNHDDVVRLARHEGHWTLRYWERGKARSESFRSKDMNEAIQAYETYIMSIQHWHFVGSTRSLQMASSVKKQLLDLGIVAKENDIPNFNGTDDYVHRLYVTGPEIFKVEAAFGKKILTDEGPI